VISFSADDLEKVKSHVGACPFEVIGKVSHETLAIMINGVPHISVPIVELESAWQNSLANRLEN
jgi:hypothetical protein